MSSGLQRQRTELAWLRTMLSCWAVALLTTRIAFPFGALALGGPVAVTAIAWTRRRRLRDTGSPPPLSRGAGVLIAVACVVVAAAGVFS